MPEPTARDAAPRTEAVLARATSTSAPTSTGAQFRSRTELIGGVHLIGRERTAPSRTAARRANRCPASRRPAARTASRSPTNDLAAAQVDATAVRGPRRRSRPRGPAACSRAARPSSSVVGRQPPARRARLAARTRADRARARPATTGGAPEVVVAVGRRRRGRLPQRRARRAGEAADAVGGHEHAAVRHGRSAEEAQRHGVGRRPYRRRREGQSPALARRRRGRTRRPRRRARPRPPDDRRRGARPSRRPRAAPSSGRPGGAGRGRPHACRRGRGRQGQSPCHQGAHGGGGRRRRRGGGRIVGAAATAPRRGAGRRRDRGRGWGAVRA